MAREPSSKQLTLPTLVFGAVEVRRLSRELEALDEYFQQNAIRNSAQQVTVPKVSRMLEALASENHMNLLQGPERQILTNFLRDVTEVAPSVHISFAVDPSAAFTAKIVTWLRSNIHPYTLLQLGLQPSIAAGCTVRTPNHLFDFSLRQHLSNQRELLLNGLRQGPAA